MSKYQYPVRIEESTKPALTELAGRLGILVETPGGFYGQPSVAAMLDLIAKAYEKAPLDVVSAFKQLGISVSQQ